MKIKVTSEEVNFLVYKYLMESGFSHASFAFQNESHIHRSSIQSTSVPPGALINLLQKGLQYYEIECHLNPDGSEIVCDEPFSVIHPHVCAPKSKIPRLEIPADGKGSTQQAHVDLDLAFVQLRGHAAEVFSCVWNPLHETLLSGSCDGTALIWKSPEASDFTITAVLFPDNCVKLVHRNPIEDQRRDIICAAWNDDGSLIATGYHNGIVNIWDEKGTLVSSFEKHTKPVFSVKWNKKGDSLVSISLDKTAIVWDIKTKEIKQSYAFHSGPIFGVDWKSNIAFATCSSDKTIQLCKVGEQKPLKVWQGHTEDINGVAWDPSCNILASCSDDSTVKLWSMRQEAPIFDLQGHSKEVTIVTWSPTGLGSKNATKPGILASGSNDGSIRLWNPENGACIQVISQHGSHVTSMVFSPDGEYIATGCEDRITRIFSVKDGLLLKAHKGPSGIFDVNWSPKGDRLAVSYAAGIVNVFDTTCLFKSGS
eukprot:TRINITY_DN9775_c0_g1_i1.p1 TRINITY_DN9775_c0_g1~~TRINITY_DN9775_c0_g1_i1.p1  ORF type:complete len:481 (+),score=70.87 TRINITY_DN9775_c0_g1_i1:74-1516(+)